MNIPDDGSVTADKIAVGTSPAIAGSQMAVSHQLEQSSPPFPVAAEGGIWGQNTYAWVAVANTFDATNAPSTGGSPAVGLFVFTNNNGASGDVVALLADAVGRQNNTAVFGANLIVRNDAGKTGVKMVGLEIDIEPSDGAAPGAGSAGIYLNAFNESVPGAAFQTGGINGGTFDNGIVLHGIKLNGVSPVAGTTMKALIQSGVATYLDDAIVLANGHKLRLGGTGAVHGKLWMDSNNNVRLVLGSGSLAIRNSADTTSLHSLNSDGSIDVTNQYRVNGTKVIGSRQGAISNASANTSSNTTAINAILSALRTHGLIAP